MSDQFFIRMRGRIQGPFTVDQLQTLARRGQFSRTHEVSEDGVNWSRAASRSELFPPVQERRPLSPQEQPTIQEAAKPEPGPPQTDVWYYHQLGANHGPCDFKHLQQLASVGQIAAEDLVWTDGMTGWTQAGHVPGLIRAAVAAVPPPGTAQAGSLQMKSCPFCAEQIAASAIKCKHCGSMLIPIQQGFSGGATPAPSGLIRSSNPPSPLLMALLSGCCIAGLGQIILGQTAKGVVILLASMALGAVTSGVSILVTWPLGGIDAYLIAKKLKDGKSVGPWEFF